MKFKKAMKNFAGTATSSVSSEKSSVANGEKFSTGRECYSNRKALRKVNPERTAVESADLISFEEFIVEKGGLSDTEQKKLYEAHNLEKIEVFLEHFFFCIEIQQRIIKNDDLDVAEMFLANWHFAIPAHSTLVNFASAELWEKIIPVTKLCNEAEVNFAKTAPMARLMHYRNCHDMCKKAENICRDVRKVKE